MPSNTQKAAVPNAICVIPARYASNRLPGKPLLPLKGKPIVQWVYEAAVNSSTFREVVVATDDSRIVSALKDFNTNVVITSKSHRTGSDRVWEIVKNKDYDIIVNLQGDEPFIIPSILHKLVNTLENDHEADIVTLIKKADSTEEIKTPSTAKVVLNQKGYAMYFSRAPIPLEKKGGIKNTEDYFIHIGVYAYRKTALKQFINAKSPPIETIESLEQLRALWYGLKIKTVLVHYSGISIDTPEDYQKALQTLGEKND